LSRLSLFLSSFVIVLVLCAFVVWPEIDIAVSGLFVSEGQFFLRDNLLLNGLAKTAFYGARLLFAFLALGAVVTYARKKAVAGISGKACVFLLLSLLIGPGLMANVVFKDHWGRARPRDVELFGGTKPFVPAAIISDACHRNCSFVSGDASFGFFLPAFAYVVPQRRRRHVFWGAVGVGSLFAGARILLGAHFLSDVVYACVLVTAVSAGLHALIFGKKETLACWKEWLPLRGK